MERPTGGTVLLVEEQPLIALYVEELLTQSGYDDVHICPSCAAADEWLQRYSPVLAIIETKLRDGACNGIAKILAARRIPFIIHSGDRNWDWLEKAVEGECRWLEKPCDPDEFIQAVRDCAARP